MLSFLIVVSISLAVLAYSFGGVDFEVADAEQLGIGRHTGRQGDRADLDKRTIL